MGELSTVVTFGQTTEIYIFFLSACLSLLSRLNLLKPLKIIKVYQVCMLEKSLKSLQRIISNVKGSHSEIRIMTDSKIHSFFFTLWQPKIIQQNTNTLIIIFNSSSYNITSVYSDTHTYCRTRTQVWGGLVRVWEGLAQGSEGLVCVKPWVLSHSGDSDEGVERKNLEDCSRPLGLRGTIYSPGNSSAQCVCVCVHVKHISTWQQGQDKA